MKQNGICCICGKPYEYYGNNSDPLTTDENARVCNMCDWAYVIPARIMQTAGRRFTLEDARRLQAEQEEEEDADS